MEAKRYEAFVNGLDKRGHSDDIQRKKRRAERLLLVTFDEKAGGFTPGQLTQTSQLSRLGQQVLRKPFASLAEPPVFVALPGQLTARARAAWSVLGCLADAAPGVLETTTDAEGRERREVKTKTEIRNVTHLHHALDACVLALAADRFPNRGDIWRALIERRPNPAQRAQLEPLDLGEFDAAVGIAGAKGLDHGVWVHALGQDAGQGARGDWGRVGEDHGLGQPQDGFVVWRGGRGRGVRHGAPGGWWRRRGVGGRVDPGHDG
jgi:hypothetical protein